MSVTSEAFAANYTARTNSVTQIALYQDLVLNYTSKNDPSLLKSAQDHLVQAYFDLFLENREYDEMVTRWVEPAEAPKKSLWKKLFRK